MRTVKVEEFDHYAQRYVGARSLVVGDGLNMGGEVTAIVCKYRSAKVHVFVSYEGAEGGESKCVEHTFSNAHIVEEAHHSGVVILQIDPLQVLKIMRIVPTQQVDTSFAGVKVACPPSPSFEPVDFNPVVHGPNGTHG